MIGVVIVSHRDLAREVLETARFIVGDLPQAAAVGIGGDEGAETIRKRLRDAIAGVDSGDGVLILTDMFGGTPTNLSLSFLAQDKVEVLTGVNLPMLIKLATSRGQNAPLPEVARQIQKYGRKNISLAREILEQRRGREPEG